MVVKVRNFKAEHIHNSYIIGVFDCCQNDSELGFGHPLIVLDPVKGDKFDAYPNQEVKNGVSNLLMVFGCEPTRTTQVSDRVTHALFEYL